MRPHTHTCELIQEPLPRGLLLVPPDSPSVYELIISLLEFSISTGALSRGVLRSVFSGGVTVGNRKLRMGPEKGLGGMHSLLDLYHGNRDSQHSGYDDPQPPCSSHTESYFS